VNWNETYREGVDDSLEDLLFVLDMIDVLGGDDLGLLHRLDSELRFGARLQPSYSNVSESTYNQTQYSRQLLPSKLSPVDPPCPFD